MEVILVDITFGAVKGGIGRLHMVHTLVEVLDLRVQRQNCYHTYAQNDSDHFELNSFVEVADVIFIDTVEVADEAAGHVASPFDGEADASGDDGEHGGLNVLGADLHHLDHHGHHAEGGESSSSEEHHHYVQGDVLDAVGYVPTVDVSKVKSGLNELQDVGD